MRHNHTGAKTWASKEFSKLTKPKARQFLRWRGAFWALKVNVTFLHFSVTIQTHSKGILDSGWFWIQQLYFQNHCLMRFLQSSNANRESFGGLSWGWELKKKSDCPQELSGRTMFSSWAWQIQCVKHHPGEDTEISLRPDYSCISSGQRCSTLKKHKWEDTSIFKGILDKMANYAQKEFETCTSCDVFCTGMFWQMDAFRQRN